MTTKPEPMKIPKQYAPKRGMVYSTPQAAEEIARKTRFGALPARPGATFALDNGPKEKPSYVVVGDRDLHPKADVAAVCLRCGVTFDTPAKLMAAHDFRELQEAGETHPFSYVVTADSDGSKRGDLLSSLREFYPEENVAVAPSYTLPEENRMKREGYSLMDPFAGHPLAGR